MMDGNIPQVNFIAYDGKAYISDNTSLHMGHQAVTKGVFYLSHEYVSRPGDRKGGALDHENMIEIIGRHFTCFDIQSARFHGMNAV